MRPRLVVFPLLVLAAAGALLLLQRRDRPAGGGAGPGPGASGPEGGKKAAPAPPRGPPPGPFEKWPAHVEVVPRTESVPARVRCPEPVSLVCPLRSLFVEVPARPGAAVRKGDLLARVNPEPYEKMLAEARKSGDAAKERRARESLEKVEIRAPADGIVFRLEASLGETPPFGRDGPKPCVVLLDWKAILLEGTATGATADLVRGGAPLLVQLPGDGPLPAEKAREPVHADGGGLALAVRPLEAPGVVPEPGGEASILVHAGTSEAFSVPLPAILVREGRTVVYVVTVQGGLEERPVAVGARLPNGRVVVSGVRAGESVAVWESSGK